MVARISLQRGGASGTLRPQAEPGNESETIVAAACVLLAGSAATIALWPEPVPQSVDVNFISHPYEATIYLDGKPLLDSAGRPEKTPCTAEDLPPRPHHVIFKHPARPDLDAGRFNFAKTREIEVRW